MSRQMQLIIKRVIDLIGAIFLLISTAPIMIVIGLLIPIKLGPGGVFFKQMRPGFREKPFQVIKFRSMLEKFDDTNHILPESVRLTSFGWLLRRYSIDELPQLFNVLIGQMSLVGPRPLLMEYLEAYPLEYRRRHDVKPGISGWAQIKGRHLSTFSQRLAMDIWYVDHWSVFLDIKIIMLTLSSVILSRNVKRPDQPITEVDDLDLHRSVQPRMRDKTGEKNG